MGKQAHQTFESRLRSLPDAVIDGLEVALTLPPDRIPLVNLLTLTELGFYSDDTAASFDMTEYAA